VATKEKIMLDVLIICLSVMIILLQLIYGSLVIELYRSSSHGTQVRIKALSTAIVLLQVFFILYLLTMFFF
jgi:hypothetical protein